MNNFAFTALRRRLLIGGLGSLPLIGALPTHGRLPSPPIRSRRRRALKVKAFITSLP